MVACIICIRMLSKTHLKTHSHSMVGHIYYVLYCVVLCTLASRQLMHKTSEEYGRAQGSHMLTHGHSGDTSAMSMAIHTISLCFARRRVTVEFMSNVRLRQDIRTQARVSACISVTSRITQASSSRARWPLFFVSSRSLTMPMRRSHIQPHSVRLPAAELYDAKHVLRLPRSATI
jgi:hypothetical protein